jgi:hypothetical protein
VSTRTCIYLVKWLMSLGRKARNLHTRDPERGQYLIARNYGDDPIAAIGRAGRGTAPCEDATPDYKNRLPTATYCRIRGERVIPGDYLRGPSGWGIGSICASCWVR